LEALYILKNSTLAPDCIARDIFDTGARLQSSAPQKLTEILDLFIPLKGQSFHAKVQRKGSDEIGIAFHARTKAVLAGISLDRRRDQLESEITLLRQAANHLQKNNDKKTASGTRAR
jgi:hypothetical protein